MLLLYVEIPSFPGFLGIASISVHRLTSILRSIHDPIPIGIFKKVETYEGYLRYEIQPLQTMQGHITLLSPRHVQSKQQHIRTVRKQRNPCNLLLTTYYSRVDDVTLRVIAPNPPNRTTRMHTTWHTFLSKASLQQQQQQQEKQPRPPRVNNHPERHNNG